jgi:peptidoglycan/xylan/chitin deacetylase (PgdA/CDA1 family)
MSRNKKLVGSVARVLHGILGSRAGSRAGILLYHRVQPWTPELPEPSFSVTPELFRAQLSGLIAAGFRFVRLDEVLRVSRTGKSLPRQSVVLTFDDAFESIYHHAYPVLRELGIPAVAFLCTAYLDSSDPFPFDAWGQAYRNSVRPEAFRPMRVDQCRAMAESGLFAFGAHTHTHQDFRGRCDDLRRDLRQSVDIVRELFASREVPFAFPYGKTDLGYAGGAMSEAARAAGVCCGLTADCALIDPTRDDPFGWGRFSCCSWDTADTLAAKLAGWYGWAPRMQRWFDQIRGFDRSVEFDPPMITMASSTEEPLVGHRVLPTRTAISSSGPYTRANRRALS